MEPEIYFLRYAFPCAFIALERGEIDRGTYRMLKVSAAESKIVKREILEKVFWRALKRLRVLAQQTGGNEWDLDVIKKYFRERHNQDIEKGVGIYAHAPESLKELSKVLEAKVIDKRQDCLIVKYSSKTRTVSNMFVPDSKPGDRVTIHYGFAVEKI